MRQGPPDSAQKSRRTTFPASSATFRRLPLIQTERRESGAGLPIRHLLGVPAILLGLGLLRALGHDLRPEGVRSALELYCRGGSCVMSYKARAFRVVQANRGQGDRPVEAEGPGVDDPGLRAQAERPGDDLGLRRWLSARASGASFVKWSSVIPPGRLILAA